MIESREDKKGLGSYKNMKKIYLILKELLSILSLHIILLTSQKYT